MKGVIVLYRGCIAPMLPGLGCLMVLFAFRDLVGGVSWVMLIKEQFESLNVFELRTIRFQKIIDVERALPPDTLVCVFLSLVGVYKDDVLHGVALSWFLSFKVKVARAIGKINVRSLLQSNISRLEEAVLYYTSQISPTSLTVLNY